MELILGEHDLLPKYQDSIISSVTFYMLKPDAQKAATKVVQLGGYVTIHDNDGRYRKNINPPK
jgi:hypothetical protein